MYHIHNHSTSSQRGKQSILHIIRKDVCKNAQLLTYATCIHTVCQMKKLWQIKKTTNNLICASSIKVDLFRNIALIATCLSVSLILWQAVYVTTTLFDKHFNTLNFLRKKSLGFQWSLYSGKIRCQIWCDWNRPEKSKNGNSRLGGTYMSM